MLVTDKQKFDINCFLKIVSIVAKVMEKSFYKFDIMTNYYQIYQV